MTDEAAGQAGGNTTADETFNVWWPRHAVKHNSRSPKAAREAFDAGYAAGCKAQLRADVEVIEREAGKCRGTLSGDALLDFADVLRGQDGHDSPPGATP